MVLCITGWVLVIWINLPSYGADNLDYLLILLSSDRSHAEVSTCNNIGELVMRWFCKRTLGSSINFTRTNCTMCFFVSNMPEF